MIELREGDRKAFFETPFSAYDEESGYVSPMRSDLFRMLDGRANPLFNTGNPFAFWTAHRFGRPVGRILATKHGQSNARHGTSRAQFGFFDCGDDRAAAACLLGAAEEFARAQGCDEIAGNFNLTAMQQAGVMTGGFGRQAYTDMVVNPPHVPRLLEENGYEPFFPMTTFELKLNEATPPAGDFEALEREGYSFAAIEKKHFAERMEEARIVLNDGFDRNPMFVPLTPEEFTFQAGEMMAILDPALSAVLHQKGRPVGVIVCIPDLNPFMKAVRSRMGLTAPIHFLWHRIRRRRAVIIFYSVVRDRHGQGLNSAMLARVIAALRKGGYRSLGITWIGDENKASLRQMEKIGARPLHRLNLFRKALA